MAISLDIPALEAYIEGIVGFDELEASQKIPFFAHFVLEYTEQDYFTPADVNACFSVLHIKPYSNIPAFVSKKAKGKKQIFVTKSHGYKIERKLLKEIQSKIPTSTSIQATKSCLREHVNEGLPEFSKAFLEEAISCFEYKLYRSSVVMVWLFAIDHMFEYIIRYKLTEFNSAYAKDSANKKSLQIKDKDDFSEIGEKKIIELCRAANIISNDVRKILEQKLDIRNTYAHPANIKITETKCSDFITDLLDNVVSKYKF
jgi:hypothetical protein